jgi:hypothetical protein
VYSETRAKAVAADAVTEQKKRRLSGDTASHIAPRRRRTGKIRERRWIGTKWSRNSSQLEDSL